MTPQTFLIESDNPYLLKALVEDLVKAGYKSTWGKPYEYCNYISSNVYSDMLSPNYKEHWKLYMNANTIINFDVTFNLPQEYSQAFDFAVEQLQVVTHYDADNPDETELEEFTIEKDGSEYRLINQSVTDTMCSAQQTIFQGNKRECLDFLQKNFEDYI